MAHLVRCSFHLTQSVHALGVEVHTLSPLPDVKTVQAKAVWLSPLGASAFGPCCFWRRSLGHPGSWATRASV